MESQRRLVELGSWDKEQRKLVYNRTGMFCGWGVDFVEFETGPGNLTAAIVEFDDGTVELVHPRNMRFVTTEEK